MHNLRKFVLWLAFSFVSFVPVAPLCAQDAPPDNFQAADTAQQQNRIVDHRPDGYFIKRSLHPLTWVDAGILRPLYRFGTSPLAAKLRTSSGPMKIGVGGAGPGSGFGPLVTPIHHAFFGRAIEIETPLLYTYKNYQVYEFNLHAPAAKSYFFLDGRYRSRPQDKFFGIGNDTPLSNESFFKTVHREVAAGYSAVVNDNLGATLGIGFDNVGVTDPQSGEPAQERFTESNTPGLFTGATMRAVTLTVHHNTQDDLHRATRGGQEIVEVGLHESVGSEDFAFWKYRVELQRFFSLSQDKRKIIAFRAMAETNQEKGGSSVPFFELPYLGSWRTVRGFEDYRYRDKSALAVGLEYRYRIWRALDWGWFVDRGQVAPEPGDFGWSRFHTGYGTRLIMLPNPKLPVTVDLGRSNEKWRLYVNFNPTF